MSPAHASLPLAEIERMLRVPQAPPSKEMAAERKRLEVMWTAYFREHPEYRLA